MKIIKRNVIFIIIPAIISTVIYSLYFTKLEASTNEKSFEDYLVDYSTDIDPDIRFLLDDSFITRQSNMGDVSYYRHYFDERDRVEISGISRFVLSTGTTAFIDNSLYVHAAVVTDNVRVNRGLQNVFYKIDFINNEINAVLRDNEFSPVVFMYPYDENILVLLHSQRPDGQYVTSMRILDVEAMQFSSLSDDHLYNQSKQTGQIITNCYAFNEYIYAVIQNYTNENIEVNLHIFDSSFELLNKMNMDKVNIEYFSSSGFNKMAVYEDYIFIQSNSTKSNSKIGMIGLLYDNSIIPLYTEDNLDIAFSFNNNEKPPIFFIRGSNKYVLIDKGSKNIRTIDLEIKNGYKPKNIYTTDSMALICLENNEYNSLIYHIPYDIFLINTNFKSKK